MTKKSLKEFEIEYSDFKPKLERLRNSLTEQINEMIISNNISLGFPIQSRTKSFESIKNKIEERRFNLKNSITELQDLVGVRIILLFNQDVKTICKILSDNLEIVKKYNTNEKLQDNQFGYSSEHYIVKIPENWLDVPTFKDSDICNVEIQIRTLSQHIWVEASNTFQYKQEDNIPREIKRSISRVSALLETIDLEFDRLLTEREKYKENPIENYDKNEILNVDLLAKILDNKLPNENKVPYQEEYSDLLGELLHFKVNTVEKLNNLIDEYYKYALEEDVKMVEIVKADDSYDTEDRTRANFGVFFTHLGLMRTILEKKFGEKYKKHRNPWF